MMTLVVTIGFVSEARSKGVRIVAGGDVSSKVSAPSASCQIVPPLVPTSTVAAGNAAAAIASASTRRALFSALMSGPAVVGDSASPHRKPIALPVRVYQAAY